MKTRVKSWLLVITLLVSGGAMISTAHPVERTEVLQQYGTDWAGPDLRSQSRSRDKGDIVGKPPEKPIPTRVERVKAPDTGQTTPPEVQPNTNPESVSIAPQPPELPPLNVGGGVPVQALFDNGSLIPVWKGQGRVAGEMLELTLTNTTNQPIAIDMDPGVVLELEDETLAQEFQPVMLESDRVLLVPANGTLTTMLRGYCLDYSLDPPFAGRVFPYRFPADTTAYAPAIDVLKASLTYDAEMNVLPPGQQRTVVIQRSIWASLGQGDKQKLYEDILSDARSAGKEISKKKAKRIADRLWNEVERLLDKAQ